MRFSVLSHLLRLCHLTLVVAGLTGHLSTWAVAQQITPPKPREVIVSYAEQTGRLQLYRVMEDGSSRRRITNGDANCMMPAWSPDGRKVVYVRQSEKGLDLWRCDPDGRQHVRLTQTGANRIPSWLPDSKHIVWMVSEPGKGTQDPAANSCLWMMNTDTKQSRPLFRDAGQMKYSNAMPVVSPDGQRVAFVSNRDGVFRVWVSDLDGRNAKRISPVAAERDEALDLPIEQKVPAWSPDGKWIAHWEGVEMTHMSRFTGRPNPQRDQQIAATFHVWVVGSDGQGKRKAGRGDDPNWSPDGFVTRSFPDPKRGGVNVMIERAGGWQELPIVPAGTTRYGRFTWKPN